MKRLLPLFIIIALLFGGCSHVPNNEDQTTHILATTYPVYLFTCELVKDVDHVKVSQLIREEVACLHDYTLTVNDMKAIERADVIIINGAGLEVFMDHALSSSKASVIDSSTGLELLPASGHEHHNKLHDEHEHDGHYDPHYWLDPEAAKMMLTNIASGLSAIDPSRAHIYFANLEKVLSQFSKLSFDSSDLSCPYMITFHDGFRYLAHTGNLTLLKSIEEEEGSEASAAEIKEIISLIKQYHIPAIFTETNGSDRTAKVIARETGVEIYQLDMLMSGDGNGISAYIETIMSNYSTIKEALS